MERKIGEIFEYNDEWYQCVEGNDCEECIFSKNKCYPFVSDNDPIGHCEADKRTDNKNTIFKKLEKIGNILCINGKTYQCIKPVYHNGCIGCTFAGSCKHICSGQGIYVGIKQNKEMLKKRDLTVEDREIYLVIFSKDLFDKLSINEWNDLIFSYEEDEKKGRALLSSDGKTDNCYITTTLKNVLENHSIYDLRFLYEYRTEYHKSLRK